jgi:predicted small lipoprotein YifL
MNRCVLSLAALLAALAIAACGGGGDELSKSELVSQADKICKDTSEQLDKIPTPNKPSDLSEYGQKASDVIGDGTKKLKELQPASDVKKDYDTFTNAAERQKELASDLAGVAKSGDRAKIQSVLTDAQKADSDGKAAAGRIGFKECGKS